MRAKRHYVLMERIGDGPKINGADSWLCPWRDVGAFLTSPLEEIGEGVPYTVRFTILSMTDDELAAYCEKHDIEWGTE